MTQLVAVARRSDFEAAITAARRVGEDGPLTGLAAPLDVTLRARVNEAWDAIESALRRAYERGVDAAQTQIDAAIQKTEELLEAAGQKARDLHDVLLARMQEYLSVFLDQMFARVRARVTIGDRELSVTAVQVQQTFSLGGSLKASIQEICSITGSGQLAVTVQYGTPTDG